MLRAASLDTQGVLRRYAHDPAWPDCAHGLGLLLRAARRYGLTRDDDGTLWDHDGWMFCRSHALPREARDASLDILSMGRDEQLAEYRRLCAMAGVDLPASLDSLVKGTESTDAG